MELSDVTAILGLFLCCAIGLVLTALRLPGIWLIVATAGVYGWWTGWDRLTPRWLVMLVVLAVVAELVELLASVFTARRAGASRQAGWGGLIGGIIGMVVFSIPIPIPFLGAAVGALIGCFAGAAIAEFVFSSNPNGGSFSSDVGKTGARSIKVGFFAAIGFILGTAAKMAIALVLTGLLLTSAVCSGSPTP